MHGEERSGGSVKSEHPPSSSEAYQRVRRACHRRRPLRAHMKHWVLASVSTDCAILSPSSLSSTVIAVCNSCGSCVDDQGVPEASIDGENRRKRRRVGLARDRDADREWSIGRCVDSDCASLYVRVRESEIRRWQ
jgi:hypothetical protein